VIIENNVNGNNEADGTSKRVRDTTGEIFLVALYGYHDIHLCLHMAGHKLKADNQGNRLFKHNAIMPCNAR
jgi:hypothetical protein